MNKITARETNQSATDNCDYFRLFLPTSPTSIRVRYIGLLEHSFDCAVARKGGGGDFKKDAHSHPLNINAHPTPNSAQKFLRNWRRNSLSPPPLSSIVRFLLYGVDLTYNLWTTLPEFSEQTPPTILVPKKRPGRFFALQNQARAVLNFWKITPQKSKSALPLENYAFCVAKDG